MNRYRNKLVYNNQTGEIRDDRKQMSMLEDFWTPRREGGRGTEITTLPRRTKSWRDRGHCVFSEKNFTDHLIFLFQDLKNREYVQYGSKCRNYKR